jgi:hypothetical protein
MRRTGVTIGFRAPAEFAAEVKRAAEASKLTVSKWVYAVVEQAVRNRLAVRERVTYEVIEPKPVLRVAEKRKA